MSDTPPKPTEEGERIAKVIARAGRASRREAERLVEAGRVAVNGKVIASPALNVTPTDRITVDGAPLGPPDPPRLWLYHKPVGLVTTERDEKGRPTVFAALPADMPRVMSVGRLDLTSEGLLLLTNDGDIKRRLELPSTGWTRKYRVRVHGTPEDTVFEPLRRGIEVEGERFQPMTVSLDRQQGANAWVTVSLTEGKNREVRRAMEAVGLTVNRLIRVSYGPFRLGELKPGAVEEVRPRVLRDQLGLAETPRQRPVRAEGAPRGRAEGGSTKAAAASDPARKEAKPAVRKEAKAVRKDGAGPARKEGKPPVRKDGASPARRDGTPPARKDGPPARTGRKTPPKRRG